MYVSWPASIWPRICPLIWAPILPSLPSFPFWLVLPRTQHDFIFFQSSEPLVVCICVHMCPLVNAQVSSAPPQVALSSRRHHAALSDCWVLEDAHHSRTSLSRSVRTVGQRCGTCLAAHALPTKACGLPSLGLEPWRLCGSDHVVGEASHPVLGSVSSFCVLPEGPGGVS